MIEDLTFEKSLNVATFFGAVAVAVLTFLFQVDETKLLSGEYKEILIVVTGMAATFLIMSVFAIKVVLVDKLVDHKEDKFLKGFCIIALSTYEAGFSLLAILLPLLVYSISPLCAIIIGMIEGGWAAIFFIYKGKMRSVHKRRIQNQ